MPAESPGTLEALVGELTKLLAPLTGFSPDAAPAVLPELGLPVDEAQARTIGAALGKTTSAIGKLIDVGFALDEAIQDEAWEKVVEKGIAAIDQISKLVSGFADLKTALASLGLPGAGPILASLPEHLFSWLLAQYFSRSVGVVPLLELTGILERTDHNVDTFEATKPFYTTNTFHFDRVGGWMTNPGGQLEALYDWGKPGFTGKKIFAVIDRIVGEMGLPSLYLPSASPPSLDLGFIELTPHPYPSPKGIAVRLKTGLDKSTTELRGQSWTFSIGLDAKVPSGTVLALTPGAVAVMPPEATKISGTITATYAYLREASDPLLLLSVTGGSKVSVEEVSGSISLGVDKSGNADLALGADLKRGKVLITMKEADGFLGTLLGGVEVKNDFDVGVGFSIEGGVHFHGSSALEIQLASHVDLGFVTLDRLNLSVGIKDGKFPVALATDIKASLGPLEAVVQGIGFELDFALASGNTGNLGPLDLSAAFKPPTGVGLSIDAGVVRGGGFLLFDTEREEYGGALQLDIAGLVSAKAIGLVTTRMPDGSKGFSLIIIISVEFSPAFQLGYGFTLIGVGGLLGVNRSVDLQKLRDGVRTGAVDNLMFPHDVVANAPQIISDLRTVFPPKEGVFLVGPMAKLGWGTPTLVSLAVGLILEIPSEGSPAIAILGVLKIALPTDDVDLLRIQVNFVGTIDFDKGLLAFDASLYDSHILFLTLEGDLAVRFKWSAPAGFLISIGGFHPSYSPPAELEVPPMKRLAINILDTDFARIRVEVYFAVTSNTVQTGARAEIYLGFDAFYVDGYLGFDALFQFSPFHFEIGIACGFTLHVFGMDLLSIRVQFSLSGPSPWRAWGTGSITILFWDISADFDIHWGDPANTTLPDVDVLPLLLEDLAKPEHWRALPPDRTSISVALRKLDLAKELLVLHPAGRLSVFQKVAPLDLTWGKFGTQKPADIRRASLSGATSGSLPLAVESIEDQFARSHFENLSDAQKLSVPSFEAMHAGVTMGLGKDAQAGTGVERTIEYEAVVVDKERKPPFAFAFIRGLMGTMLQGGAQKRHPTSRAQARRKDPYPDDKVPTPTDAYTVVATKDNRAHGAAATFPSEAMARDALLRTVAKSPDLRDALHVVPCSEVNRS